MMIKKTVLICCVLAIYTSSKAQSTGLTNSPYSLYGLGVQNQLSTGKTNTLGNTGIALPSDTFINNLNPASFGGISSNRFLMDLGIKVENETLYEDDNSEKRFNANFSSIGFAFPINKKSGFGFTLIPFTNVGYQVFGIENQIDGSTDTFVSNINGSGGLNDININYGYALTDNFRFGLKGTFLFGNIKENEIDIIEQSVLTISEENFYNGFRLGAGFQYDINDKYKLGAVVSLPTVLKGDQTNTVFVAGSGAIITENQLDDFKLPLEFGIGTSISMTQRLMLNVDYRRNFWSATEQSDAIGTFIDQDILGIGAEYIPNLSSLKYWDRVNYRLGFNADNGNLDINNSRVNNLAFNVGLGFPLRTNSNTMLNFGYSYGQKGQVSNGLIKENYHLLTLNFSLEGIWFQKRRYD